MKYKRILLKLSGEFFQSCKDQTIDFQAIKELSQEIISVQDLGIEISIVVGAGNLFRGRHKADWFPEEAAHYMGILATLPNAIALAHSLTRLRPHSGSGFGGQAASQSKSADREGKQLASLSCVELMSAIPIGDIIPEVDPQKAQRVLSQGKIVVFACGTGQPYVTTDTGAVMRALDIKADVLLKATKVDGVYDKDPEKFTDAEKFDKLTFSQVLDLGLEVMDRQAFELAQENNLEIRIFKYERGSIKKVVLGKEIGTIIKKSKFCRKD